MKKMIYIAAIALVAFSCSKTELYTPETGTSQTSQSIRIHTGIPQTKAIHGTGTEEGTSFAWEAEKDDINLLWIHKEEDYSYFYGPEHFKNVQSGAVACFEPLDQIYDPIAVGDTLYAIYPFKSSTSYNWYDPDKEETVLCFRTSFGSTMQVGDNNTGHMDKLDIMISKPVILAEDMIQEDGSYDVPMEFAHLFSKLRVNVVNNTAEPFSVKSIVYHSTKKDDLMSGVIYMNVKTREILSEAREWGDCIPSSNAILQTSDIEIPVGGNATLWMWMMPLDFTSTNADGRKANIYLNTSAGVFHVDGVNFDEAFKAGMTYRHKFTATELKKLSDYTLVPDASFVEALYTSTYEYELGQQLNFYDYELKVIDMSEFDPWGESPELDNLCAGGLFIKNSEAAAMTELNIHTNNAVSLEGLQAFTGLKSLTLSLSMDMSSVLGVRSLDISTLTELERMSLSNSQIQYLDLSSNTKLKSLDIDFSNDLSSISGLKNHPSISSLVLKQVGQDAGGFSADLSGCPKLKNVEIGCDVKNLNLSGADLDNLSLSTTDYSGVNMSGLKVNALTLYYAPALPTIPQNVKSLLIDNPQSISNGICKQLGLFNQLDTLDIIGWHHFGCDIEFGSANSSVKVLNIQLSEGSDAENQGGTITGFDKLSGVDSLNIKLFREKSCAPISADFSAMVNCRHFDVLLGDNLDFENFKLPASNSLKTANLRFNESNSKAEIEIGEHPSLQSFNLEAKSIRAIPFFSAESYPSLTEISMVSKYLYLFPLYKNMDMNMKYSEPEWLKYTHDAFPELSELLFHSSYGECDCGIDYIDLRPYSKLASFNCYWQYYNQSGELRQRSSTSIRITKSQETYTTVTNPKAYSVSWYGNYRNYGTINLTDPLSYIGGFAVGGYADVMDDIEF